MKIVLVVAVILSSVLPWPGTPAVIAGPETAAPAYEARRTGEVVQLEDRKNHIVVSILTSEGNVAYEMTVKGHNILRFPFASVDEFKARPGGSTWHRRASTASCSPSRRVRRGRRASGSGPAASEPAWGCGPDSSAALSDER